MFDLLVFIETHQKMVHKEGFASFYQRNDSYQPFFDGFGFISTNVGKLCWIDNVFFETHQKMVHQEGFATLYQRRILSKMVDEIRFFDKTKNV